MVIPELNPADLHRKALLTSIHREDLNSLDKAEAILRELTTATELEAQERDSEDSLNGSAALEQARADESDR